MKRGLEGLQVAVKAQIAAAFRCGAAAAGLVAAAAVAPAASAQSASDYQLPPGRPSATPRPVGPADEASPLPRAQPPATQAPATQAATPSPAAAPPAIVLPATPPRERTPRAARSGAPQVEAAPTSVQPSAAPSDTAPTAPPPPPSAAPSSVVVPPSPPAPQPTPAVPSAQPTPAAPAAPWLALLGLLAAAIAGGALLVFRRRPSKRTLPPPRVPLRASEPAVPPAPAPPPTPAADPKGPPEDLVFLLDATRLSATLVMATLSYRLVVTNRANTALTDIAIGGDMISAHASRPVEEQLGLAGPDLPPLHRIASLEPGEAVTLGGDIRLPLSAIMPIHNGEARLFVPLARFDAWASAPGGRPVRARAAFLVGQDNKLAAGGRTGGPVRLHPFRLDLGPRVYAQVTQRPLAVADA